MHSKLEHDLPSIDPPAGGCFTSCWRNEVKINCSPYSKEWDLCILNAMAF